MKVVMTLLVRDEEDIIKANIDFHLSQGVDFIIATDNRSVDGTTEILKAYEEQGVLKYIYEPEDNYNQHAWVTRMARMAYCDYGADWVINNDADEFWFPIGYANLKLALQDAAFDGYNIIEAQRSNFVYLGDKQEGQFYDTMIYRDLDSMNPLGHPLPPKQAHIGYDKIIVRQGNHSVTGLEHPKIAHDKIEIFHFPIRTKNQLLSKISKGGNAIENNTELPVNVLYTWRELFKILKSNGNLDQYLADHLYDEERIEKALKSGRIILDKTLCDYMHKVVL